jgi:hypothetical protein
MNNVKSVNRALNTLRLARRSFRGANCPKGKGKIAAHRAERRLGKALSREGEV